MSDHEKMLTGWRSSFFANIPSLEHRYKITITEISSVVAGFKSVYNRCVHKYKHTPAVVKSRPGKSEKVTMKTSEVSAAIATAKKAAKKSGKSARFRVNVDKGLWLTASSTGECVFHFRAYYCGKDFTRRLNRYNPDDHAGSLQRARAGVNAYRQWIDDGNDPRIMKLDAEEKATLRDVIEKWLALRQPVALEAIRRTFENHVYPRCGGGLVPCESLTEAHWRRMLSEIITSGTPETAKSCRTGAVNQYKERA